MNIFEKFNQQVDVEALKNEVAEASSNSNDSDFKEVPFGTYEVQIEKLEQVMTKKEPQRPMLSVWFKIISGEYKGQRMFMNQLLTGGFPIYIATEFLRSLDSGLTIEFKDYVQFANLILEVRDNIEGKKEYAVAKSDNKGYDKFTVTQVFNVGEEPAEDDGLYDWDDIPF